MDGVRPPVARPPVENIPTNTFVNPAFDGSIVSSGDSVIVGEHLPVPNLYTPLELGDVFYPAREPPPDLEVPTRRGDSLDVIGEVSGERNILVGTGTAPPQRGPFEELELYTFQGGASRGEDVEYDTWFGPDIGFDEWVGGGPAPPRVSTPGTVRPLPEPPVQVSVDTYENPVYDPAHIDMLFRQGLAEYGVSPEEVEDIGPALIEGRGASIGVRASVQARGMQLRSGRILPRLLNLLGDLSGISASEPPIQLSVFAAEGAGSVFVDGPLDTGFNDTMPWDGVGEIDTGDIELPGFVDIPLDDPFPEMEIEEDMHTGVTVGVPRPPTHVPVFIPLPRRGVQKIHVIRPVPQPAPPIPLPPFPPGVLIPFPIDPSLYWRWWRRRRHAGVSGLYYR